MHTIMYSPVWSLAGGLSSTIEFGLSWDVAECTADDNWSWSVRRPSWFKTWRETSCGSSGWNVFFDFDTVAAYANIGDWDSVKMSSPCSSGVDGIGESSCVLGRPAGDCYDKK